MLPFLLLLTIDSGLFIAYENKMLWTVSYMYLLPKPFISAENLAVREAVGTFPPGKIKSLFIPL